MQSKPQQGGGIELLARSMCGREGTFRFVPWEAAAMGKESQHLVTRYRSWKKQIALGRGNWLYVGSWQPVTGRPI
jgi:hypothetical protein